MKPRQSNAVILPAAALTAADRASMYELYSRHYDATSPELFTGDLAAKHHVLLLRDGEARIYGFTTMAVAETEHLGRRLRTIFSGDTIIDPAHWGRQDLAFAWIGFAGRIKAQAPELPLYWFLIVKGWRTYRYLSAFSIDFHPHWARDPDPWQRSLMDTLGGEHFGAAYDRETGVIRFTHSRGHLKAELARLEPGEAERPDVQLFLRRNPGWREGHEMLCLTELSAENLRPIARRQFLKGLTP